MTVCGMVDRHLSPRGTRGRAASRRERSASAKKSRWRRAAASPATSSSWFSPTRSTTAKAWSSKLPVAEAFQCPPTRDACLSRGACSTKVPPPAALQCPPARGARLQRDGRTSLRTCHFIYCHLLLKWECKALGLRPIAKCLSSVDKSCSSCK